MRRSPHSRRDDRGVVALELVIAMPMIIALIVCSIALAGLFQTKSRVVGAARDYARVLALKPGAATAPADPNTTDGITVVLDPSPPNALCPPLTNVAYQSATPPQVSARASKVYTVSVPFVGSWTRTVTETAKMPCG
jgi:Flp pilus assembly protein TadG